jgi:mono/diheme cytochrome c family protein
VLSSDERTLYVASPDDDAVVAIDAETGAELMRFAVDGAPEQLAWLVGQRTDGDHLWVTLSQRGAIADISLASGEVRYYGMPCGSTRAVVQLGLRTFVSCPEDGRVVEFEALRVIGVRLMDGAPSGLALFGDQLGVALARGGGLAIIDVSQSLDGLMTVERVALPEGVAASQSEPIAAHPIGGFALAYQRVEHDADRSRDPALGGYGSVIDGAPRIEPRLRSACGERYARFDGGALAMSSPSAVAIGGDHVWIAHLATDGVVLARCAPSGASVGDGALEVITTFRVGRGPRGIALSADGRTAFIDNGFDGSVSRLDVPSAPASRLDATWTRLRTRGPSALSAAALRGRSLFFDAVDTHLTPSGVVSCGTCHPRAGDDGLSWFLHTRGIAPKLRRTSPAWAARSALAPYHWNGELTDVAMLARSTTEELMEGDGLLIDFPAIAAYLEEVAPPAPRFGNETVIARGRAVFETAGCADCHAGALLADGALHDVLPPSADAAAILVGASTPPLVGVRARAPYFHDGRAASLADTLAVEGDRHGRTSSLSSGERDDLITYLESL